MFELISNQLSLTPVAQSVRGEFWKANHFLTSGERCFHRLAAVKLFTFSMGKPCPESLVKSVSFRMIRNPFDMVATANLKAKNIKIPALCLLNNHELPSHFRIESSEDPRLNDPQWFKEFSLWMSHHLGTTYEQPDHMEMENFKLYIKFLENPEKASKGIQFILGHELGHHVNPYEDIPFYNESTLLGGAILGSIISYWLGYEEEFPEAFLSKFCFGMVLGLTHLVALRMWWSLRNSREDEAAADQFSFKMTPGAAEGAAYVFDLITKHYRNVKKNMPSSLSWQEYLVNHFMINSEGELRFVNWTHGSFQERSAKAKDYLSQKVDDSQLQGVQV